MKKQPDKITAYYYRAANKQTDLNLDNQMHRLLSHAQENESDTYMFFVDNGYSGLTAERPLSLIHISMLDQIAEDAQANGKALLSIDGQPITLVPFVPTKGLTADENVKIITALIVSDEVYSEYVRCV